MYFGGFLALVYVATNRFSIRDHRAGPVRPRRRGSSPPPSGTCRPHRHLLRTRSAAASGTRRRVYQIAKGLFAQADGGLFGKDLGASLLYGPGGSTLIPAPDTT